MQQLTRKAVLVIGAGLLSACSSSPPEIDKIAGVEGLSEKIEASNVALEKVTIAEARAHYAGFTVKSYSPDHGTQVEYMSPDGRCFLWYPGNRIVLPCKWKVNKQPAKTVFDKKRPNITTPHVCYSYPENSYNPVTKQRGSAWQCRQALVTSTDKNGKITFMLPAPGFHPATVDKIKGDPFALARRKAVPFVMQKKTYSFPDLKKGAV